MRTQNVIKGIASGLALVAMAGLAQAGAVRDTSGFSMTTFAGNDDGSVGPVGLGFSIDFYGVGTSTCFVNNNGNVTFDAALGTFTPFDLVATSRQIIAPFFGDVDTRAGNEVDYGTGTIGGRSAFAVDWIDVGYFSRHTDKLNTFQLIIIDRSDIAAGDFDFEFNYDKIEWETGDASGGSGGLGGFSARAGWSNGIDTSLELDGSAVNGAFLDGGVNALISDRLNSDVDGRYVFRVRGGVVQPLVPLPTGAGLGMAGLIGLVAFRRRTH